MLLSTKQANVLLGFTTLHDRIVHYVIVNLCSRYLMRADILVNLSQSEM